MGALFFLALAFFFGRIVTDWSFFFLFPDLVLVSLVVWRSLDLLKL